MGKKYICYYSDITTLKWNDKLLIFDTEESAIHFADAMFNLPFFDEENIYTTSVYSAIEEAIDCINATNLRPVQNGDTVELKEVNYGC